MLYLLRHQNAFKVTKCENYFNAIDSDTSVKAFNESVYDTKEHKKLTRASLYNSKVAFTIWSAQM
jgi:hypothetical protein